MKKSIILNIETQTEDKSVISLCHVNEKLISLEISDIAKTMFKKNRSLFDRINNSTKMIGGSLFRQEVETPKKNTNKLATPILDSYIFKEREISQLFFTNGVLKTQIRAISKGGYKFDYDPDLVSNDNEGGNFDPKNLSPNDISESQQICRIEQISLFERDGIKTLMITDTLEDIKNILEIGYRIEISVENEFKDFYNYITREAEKSIAFLTSYLEVVKLPSNYDFDSREFIPSFSKEIFDGLGVQVGSPIILSKKTIRESEFGAAALSFYNLSTLLTSNVEESIYSDFLRIVLPTHNTNPEAIERMLRKFSSLLESVRKEYVVSNRQTGKEMNKYSRVSEGRTFKYSIDAVTTEMIEVEQEKLGYCVFSNRQSGLNKFSTESYKRRFALEQAKHYPNINIADTSKFLTPAERSEFSNMNNAPAFLTPTTLIMGEERIRTNRGMRNIDVDKIRQFRLAKSSRAEQKNATRKPSSQYRSKLTQDVISSFNVAISSPKTAILARSLEEKIDPLVDSNRYLGDDSYFVTNNPFELRKQFKRILSKRDRRILGIVSDIVPRRFLRNKNAIKSIKELQFTNPKSKVRKLANSKELRISEIPPHVKYMMSDAFNPNPNSDPMKNSESRQIIEETQKNLFQVRALTGFGVDSDGFLDIRDPKFEEMTPSILNSNKPILAKAFDYEIPELGITKDNFAATIYSNLAYIRG